MRKTEIKYVYSTLPQNVKLKFSVLAMNSFLHPQDRSEEKVMKLLNLVHIIHV
jgi:hypothetical protein